jgi:hypothetical protein
MKGPDARPPGVLTSEDMRFLCDVLAADGQETAIRSLMEDEDSLLAVLGLECVFRAVIESPSLVEISPTFYFTVIVHRVFGAAGMASPGLTRYVATMLASRVRLPRTPDGDTTVPDYAVEFLERAAQVRPRESFQWWKTAGDHFLVLTGLFPGYLEHRSERRGTPPLEFYEDFGARSYRTAAEHPRAHNTGLSPILHNLSDSFSDARIALNTAADELLFLAN